MAMSVTPSAVNQSAIASSDPVNEEKVRVCLRRPRPLGAGVRTQATTSSLPISIPAHRSISTSTIGLLALMVSRGGTGGANRSTTLWSVHEENSSRGREGPWHQSQRRVLAHQAVTSTAGPARILILRGGLR